MGNIGNWRPHSHGVIRAPSLEPDDEPDDEPYPCKHCEGSTLVDMTEYLDGDGTIHRDDPDGWVVKCPRCEGTGNEPEPDPRDDPRIDDRIKERRQGRT